MDASTWQENAKAHSKNSESIMNEQLQKTSATSVMSTLGAYLWPIVVIANVLLFADLLLNGGRLFVFMLFFFTGGYWGT